MKYDRKYAGKWVAVKNNKVIASGSDFLGLHKKIIARKDATTVRFSLIPKGKITGSL